MDEDGIVWAGPEDGFSEEDKKRLHEYFRAVEGAYEARLRVDAEATARGLLGGRLTELRDRA